MSERNQITRRCRYCIYLVLLTAIANSNLAEASISYLRQNERDGIKETGGRNRTVHATVFVDAPLTYAITNSTYVEGEKLSNAALSASGITHRRLPSIDPSLIPNRKQWDCNFQMSTCCGIGCRNKICDGYCGSASIQEIALYYGAYISQGIVRRMVPSNDKVGARDIWIRTKVPKKHPDLVKTAGLVGLDRVTTFYALKTGWEGVKAFTAWTKKHLQETASPVIIGVNTYYSIGKDRDGDHYVTAVIAKKNGIWFNDHYASKRRSITFDKYPDYSSGQRCKSVYCYSETMHGIAVHTPSGVASSAAVGRSRLVRLKIISNAGAAAINQEPNWTCASVQASVMTLEARAAYPGLLDAAQTWYVAVTFRGKSSQEIRNVSGGTQSLFGGTPIECYALPSVTSSVQITVQSNEAVYTRIVRYGCP